MKTVDVTFEIPFETEEALEKIAKSENKSIDFLLIKAIEEYLKKLEYEEHIKNRVLNAQKELYENGSSNIYIEEAHKNSMEKVKFYLENK